MAQFAAYKPAKLLDSVITVSNGVPTDFAISSGNNRMAAIAVCHARDAGSTPAISATMGGQPHTYRYISEIATGEISIAIFIWNELAISSMSGTSVIISGGLYAGRGSLYWSVENVIQAEIPYFSEAKKASSSGSLPLAREADSLTFSISAHDVSSSGDVGGFTNPPETGEFAGATSNLDIAYGFSSDTERTASFTWSSAFVRDNASIVLNFSPIVTGTSTINSYTPINTWVSSSYQGSKFGGLYSFSDTDNSEETLIINLSDLANLYSLSAESSSVSLNSSEVGLLTSRKLRMERGGFGIDDYTTSNVFADNFNRANGALGSNWQIEQGSFQIINNAVNSTLGDATSVATVTSGTYSADQYAQITAATFTATLFDWIGVGVRVSGLSGYFYATDRFQTRKLFKRDTAGISTEIGTRDIYWSAGDIIKITANRNVISVYKNNELVERVKDSTYTSGVPAIYYRKENNSTTTGDNFECGNLIDSTNVEYSRVLACETANYFEQTFDASVVATRYIGAGGVYLQVKPHKYLSASFSDSFAYGSFQILGDRPEWDFWDTDNTNLIQSSGTGTATQNVANRQSVGVISTAPFAADQWAEQHHQSQGAGRIQAGPLVRASSGLTTNGYSFVPSTGNPFPTQFLIVRYVNGVGTTLATSAPNVFDDIKVSTMFRFRLEAIGNNLYGYINEKLIVTATDNTFPTGKPGFQIIYGGSTYDFFAGEIDATPTSLIQQKILTCDTTNYSVQTFEAQFPYKKIRYVNTTSTSGGTGTTNATTGADRAYATLRAALETEQADLVAQNVKLEIYCAGGVDSSTSSQQNWPSMVTGPNNDIKIYAAPGNEAEESFNSNKYHIARFTGGQEAINLGTTDNLYISYYNLQIKSTLTTHVAFRIGATTSGTTTGKVVVSGCYIEGGTTAFAISFNCRNQPHVVVNSILVANGGTSSNTITSVYYNNTVISYSTGSAASAWASSTIPYYMRNNIFQNYGGGVALSGTLPTNTSTSSNITNDATSPEAFLRNITLTFKNKIGKNFRLVSDDYLSVGSGTDLSSDPIYPITVDLLGNTRTSWDIGAVKYAPLLLAVNRSHSFTFEQPSLLAQRTLPIETKAYLTQSFDTSVKASRRLFALGEYRPQTFSDNFERADESLDVNPNWLRADNEVGSLSIVGGKASGINVGNVYNQTLSNDQWVEIYFEGPFSSGIDKGAAVFLRATGGLSTFSGYSISLMRDNTAPGDILSIKRHLLDTTFSDVFTAGLLLASIRIPELPSPPTLIKLRAEVIGSTIYAYVNDFLWLTVTNSDHSSGKAGIWSDSSPIGSFSCGSIGGTQLIYQEVSVTKSSAKKIEAITQTYSIISSEASLLRGLAIPVTAQAFTLTGPPVATLANRVITTETSTYTRIFNPASVLKNSFLSANTGNFGLSSFQVETPRTYKLLCSHLSFNVTLVTNNIFKQNKIFIDSSTYLLDEQSIGIFANRKLQINNSLLTLIGYPTIFFEPTGYIKIWAGSSWELKPIKVWTGSEWSQKPLRVWNGTIWQVL